MSLSYNKLWKIMIDRDMKKMELKEVIGIGSTTLSKLSKNQPVAMNVLMRICKEFDCNIGDIVDFIND